jgi:signal transduction histidine kinase
MSVFIRFKITNEGKIHSVETQNMDMLDCALQSKNWDDFTSQFDYYYCYSEKSTCFYQSDSSEIILEKFGSNSNIALVGKVINHENGHQFEAEIFHTNEQHYQFNEFIEIIVNEIRNPIVGLIAASDLYINYGEEFQLDKDEYFQLSRNYAVRMAEFVDQVLLLMRLNEDQNTEFEEPVLFKPILNDLKKKYKKHVEAHSIGIIDHTDEAQFCMGSDELIQMAVKQVFLNSIQFGESNRTIIIDNASELHFRGLSITDFGYGIKPEQALHIFERFYRVKKETVRHHIDGIGLGLCLVKAIVRKHKGRIKVCSKPTIGTQFTLLFPSKVVEELRLKALAKA